MHHCGELKELPCIPNTLGAWTNQRPVSKSHDHSRQIRGQNLGHLITFDQLEASISPIESIVLMCQPHTRTHDSEAAELLHIFHENF